MKWSSTSRLEILNLGRWINTEDAALDQILKVVAPKIQVLSLNSLDNLTSRAFCRLHVFKPETTRPKLGLLYR
jgi:hypothetical protein